MDECAGVRLAMNYIRGRKMIEWWNILIAFGTKIKEPP